ncbi:carbon storage regulator CsrA [candidate division KSB1 bacterium]
MLVLSRRINEHIMIGDEIEITVVDVKKDLVRIGISAPRTITVHRKEVYEAIQAENLAAAQSQVADLDRVKIVFKEREKKPVKPRRPQTK